VRVLAGAGLNGALRRNGSFCASVHDQCPFIMRLIEMEDVQASVIGPDLEIAVVGAVPLVDRLHDFDLTLIEIEMAWRRACAIVGMKVGSNTHE
jgi:hypothetical protein